LCDFCNLESETESINNQIYEADFWGHEISDYTEITNSEVELTCNCDCEGTFDSDQCNHCNHVIDDEDDEKRDESG